MNKELRKMIIASIFIAISVVIDILVKLVLPFDIFGLPLYAIPLILGSMYLGPIYGMMMGFISDFVGFQLVPRGTYAILFGLSAVAWGLIPYFFTRKKQSIVRVAIGVFVAHLAATSLNTIALAIMVSTPVAKAGLFLRVGLIPLNTVILTAIIYTLNQRLREIYNTVMI